MKALRSKTKGFTLIELLTVIAIIGILAAIIIPTVGKVRDGAKSARSVANLRQCASAMLLYAGDNKSHFPVGYNDPNPASGNLPSTTTWMEKIYPYIAVRGSHQLRGSADNILTSPYHDPEIANTASYGMNVYLRHNNWKYKVNAVREPSRYLLVGDGRQQNNDFVRPSVGGDNGVATAGRRPEFRHSSKTLAQFAYADGHVQTHTSDQLAETPTNTANPRVWYWW